MEISVIFADRLYAFNYSDEGKGPDEFQRIFSLWQEAEYLEEFFELNKSDLQSGFFEPVPSVEQAVISTRLHAKQFEQKLLNLAKANDNNLDDMFRPLSEREDNFPFPRHKAYGLPYNSWLRIYAIKIEHRYYVTGGAIKLTKGMQDRPHTDDELKRIERCFQFFKELGIIDFDGVKELDL